MASTASYSNALSNLELLHTLNQQYPEYTQQNILLVNIDQQRLYQIRNNELTKAFIISSASKGTGNNDGSGKTPLGAHFIRQKIGDCAPLGSQFKGRQLTGHITPIIKTPEKSNSDNITSRILWLSGLEQGRNSGEGVDSYDRYIYIHGTDEEGLLGTPASHGCIRMANQDIIDLYTAVDLSTLVYIYEQ